jgi:hypothetical protein
MNYPVLGYLLVLLNHYDLPTRYLCSSYLRTCPFHMQDLAWEVSSKRKVARQQKLKQVPPDILLIVNPDLIVSGALPRVLTTWNLD